MSGVCIVVPLVLLVLAGYATAALWRNWQAIAWWMSQVDMWPLINPWHKDKAGGRRPQ